MVASFGLYKLRHQPTPQRSTIIRQPQSLQLAASTRDLPQRPQTLHSPPRPKTSRSLSSCFSLGFRLFDRARLRHNPLSSPCSFAELLDPNHHRPEEQPTPVHPGPPRSTPVHPGPPRSTPVHPGPPRFTPVHPGPPRSTPVHPAKPAKPAKPGLPENRPLGDRL